LNGRAGTARSHLSLRSRAFTAASSNYGCIFKLMRDGLLAECASVVDTVKCAVTRQRDMAERLAVHGICFAR